MEAPYILVTIDRTDAAREIQQPYSGKGLHQALYICANYGPDRRKGVGRIKLVLTDETTRDITDPMLGDLLERIGYDATYAVVEADCQHIVDQFELEAHRDERAEAARLAAAEGGFVDPDGKRLTSLMESAAHSDVVADAIHSAELTASDWQGEIADEFSLFIGSHAWDNHFEKADREALGSIAHLIAEWGVANHLLDAARKAHQLWHVARALAKDRPARFA